MKILVLNAGSSTLKFSLIESETEESLGEGLIDWSREPARFRVHRPGQPEATVELTLRHHGDAVVRALAELTQGERPMLSSLTEIAAVGHRVVHGGDVYQSSVRVTPEVKKKIGELTELAPLHNPSNLEGIEAAEAALPHVPQVAVFDTAFHATIPDAARIYPVPYSWYSNWRVRRYGFHGLSHAYCANRAAEMLSQSPQGLRLIICHLGNGCSISAIQNGVCIDTSMGFTPLEGLMMGTRSGSVDPGVLLHVLRQRNLAAKQLDQILNHESGLLGVSGVSGDMRQVQAAARNGNQRAQLALNIYVHRLRQTIGAMAASLNGVDVLVFTAGVGENSSAIRYATCNGLSYLGLEIDQEANDKARPDVDLAKPSSRVRILVIGTREDVMIVRETLRIVRSEQ